PLSRAGGSPGAPGLNLLLRRDGRTINLGAKTSVPVQPGVRCVRPPPCPVPLAPPMTTCLLSPPQDVFCLQTPGGGGFGTPMDAGDAEDSAEPPAPRSFAERGSLFE
ncbi:OPLA oxoprolinase, partial [Anseranas semipalmata]|nr:OPLA oxoprolinase [Anseranas semipalmata]